MSTLEINLLKRDAGSARAFSDLEQKFQIGAWWSLIGLLACGIIIGTTFFILQATSTRSISQNDRLRKQIDSQLLKEGILLSLKERTIIAGKALDADRPWGNLFPILSNLALQENIKSLSVDETGKVNLNLLFGSIDDAIVLVNNAVTLVDGLSIHSPQLVSFALREDGSVQLGLSFVPAL